MVAGAGDCNDGDGDVYPGAVELCNGVDDNCDGATDEATAGDAGTWYLDSDGDGYGDAAITQVACDPDPNYVADDTDCDDTDPLTYPGAAEVWYDGDDQDCDQGSDYDQDGDSYDSDAFGGDDLNDLDPGCWDTCQDGLSQATAGASCAQILSDDTSAADGVYWLDLDADGDTSNALQLTCDMTTESGGWTLIPFPVADVSLGGTMVPVDSAASEGIDPVDGPYTMDGSDNHTYHYSFDFLAGFGEFMLTTWVIRANATHTSDLSGGNFVQTDWTVGHSCPTGSCGWGDVSFGDANAAGPTTSYGAEGVVQSCSACTIAWPAPTTVYAVATLSTRFRVGWGEGGGQLEGWYPWYTGSVALR